MKENGLQGFESMGGGGNRRRFVVVWCGTGFGHVCGRVRAENQSGAARQWVMNIRN